MSVLVSTRPLRIVRLHGSGLQAAGTDNAISTGPYEPCGAWSDALFGHRERPDGLAYQSRHDSAEVCLALFERPDIRLALQETLPLSRLLREMAGLLDDYGKSVSPEPVGQKPKADDRPKRSVMTPRPASACNHPAAGMLSFSTERSDREGGKS